MEAINFEDLAAPIDKSEVETKRMGGETINFINARTVMNRLDKVVGPARWRDDYREVEGGILCTLYIKIDGEWVGKSDVGDGKNANYSKFKGTYSDAFKRAAVRWGIGRELYGDGTAFDNDDDPAQKQPQTPKTASKTSASQLHSTTPSANSGGAQNSDSELDGEKFAPKHVPHLIQWVIDHSPDFEGDNDARYHAGGRIWKACDMPSGETVNWQVLAKKDLTVGEIKTLVKVRIDDKDQAATA